MRTKSWIVYIVFSVSLFISFDYVQGINVESLILYTLMTIFGVYGKIAAFKLFSKKKITRKQFAIEFIPFHVIFTI